MKRKLATALLLLTAACASGRVDGRRSCVESLALIDAAGMDSSNSFSIDRRNYDGGHGLMTLFISLTDANSSITRFDVACTASNDGNTTDYTTQVCDDTSDGICTLTAVTGWQKATPGTDDWVISMDIEGYPDLECTFSVGSGSGASADLLTVDGRICVK